MKTHPLLALALALTLLQWSLTPQGGYDTDFWWHLAAGRWMWEHAQVLTRDVFSHTQVDQSWANRDWGYQVLLYGLYQLGGLNAAIGLRLILMATAAALQLRISRLRGAPPLAGWVVLFLSSTLVVGYPHVRPYFASLNLALLSLGLLEWLRQNAPQDPTQKPRAVAALMTVLLLWSNLHGGVSLVGAATVGVYVLISARRAWWKLVPLVALSMLAVPQPIESLSFVFRVTVGENPYKHILIENFPPNFLCSQERPYLVFLLLYLVGALARARKGQLLDLVLLLTYSPLLFTDSRHQLLLIPLLGPGLASMLGFCNWPQNRYGRGLLLMLAALIAARQGTWCARLGFPPQRLISWDEMPEGACRWIEAQNRDFRLFNDVHWGGYLLWRLPRCRVFMDGRAEVYGEREFLKNFLTILLNRPSAQALLDHYQVDLVLLQSPQGPFQLNPSQALCQTLETSPAWQKAYDDGVVVLFARAQQSLAQPSDLYWTQLRQRRTVDDLGRALQAAPDCPALKMELGVLLAPTRLDEAERQWELALLEPPTAGIHLNLARAAMQRGDATTAACELQEELWIREDAQVRQMLESLAPVPAWQAWVRARWRWFFRPLRAW